MDEEGFIFVEDRAKDMVLRAGENIYSAEVEAVNPEASAERISALLSGRPFDQLRP